MKTRIVEITTRQSEIAGKVINTKTAYVFTRNKHVGKIKIEETNHFYGPENESDFAVFFPFSAEVIICQENCYSSRRSVKQYQNGKEIVLFESTIFTEASSEEYKQIIVDLKKRFKQVF